MTPEEIESKMGYCPFCLAINNYAAMVRVHFHNAPNEIAPQNIMTNPVQLIAWLNSHRNNPEKHFRTFELNAATYAFMPVAIIKNTPLCVVHLWDVCGIPQRIKL